MQWQTFNYQDNHEQRQQYLQITTAAAIFNKKATMMVGKELTIADIIVKCPVSATIGLLIHSQSMVFGTSDSRQHSMTQLIYLQFIFMLCLVCRPGSQS